MNRRNYLRAVATGGSVAVAGCLGGVAGGGGGVLGGGNPNTVLGQPDRRAESEDLAYPAWGERIPDVTLPAPIEGGEVALREVDVPYMTTFFYSHCRTVCPVLVGALRNVQAHSLENGYADAVRFLPVTFDPERDDADRLRTYADRMHVDLDANWTFLRPAGVDRAKAVVNGEFGVGFRKTEEKQEGGGGDGHHHEGYGFVHFPLIQLVNADGYVERTYTGKSPDSEPIVADLRRVRRASG